AGIYFPIRGFGETVGVLAYQPKYLRPLTISEMNLLQTVNQQVGVYVQRALTRESFKDRLEIQHSNCRRRRSCLSCFLIMMAQL
ncbi:MAG: hypothetical protein ACHQUC_00575, partial [Chlamydiales bacterium]